MIRVSREWKNPQVFSLAQGTGFNRDRSEDAQEPSWPLQPSKSRQTKAPRAMRADRPFLLVMQDRRAPAWVERRLPSGGRWLWSLLLGLTILCYVSLAPTFLFFLVHLKK